MEQARLERRSPSLSRLVWDAQDPEVVADWKYSHQSQMFTQIRWAQAPGCGSSSSASIQTELQRLAMAIPCSDTSMSHASLEFCIYNFFASTESAGMGAAVRYKQKRGSRCL